MRVLVLAVLLVGCSQAAPPPTPERVAQALQRAGVDGARARVLQSDARRALVVEPLAGAPAESDGTPGYRVLGYDAASDAVRELLPRAGWAAWAGEALLAVEGERLTRRQGAAMRVLLDHVAPDFAVDPSGRWIAAVVKRPELALDTDLVLLPAVGGEPRPLAAFDGSSESRPIFTPDDRAVVFVSGRGGLAGLWRVELATGAARQLTNAGLKRVAGQLPEGFIPVPPDAASVRWEGADTLVYEAGGRTIRVNAGGAR